MSTAALGVPASLVPRLNEAAERLGRPVAELVEEALSRYLEEIEPEEDPVPGFDQVIFGEGEAKFEFSAEEFRELPMRRQVRLLMGRPSHFYREGREVPREQAMSLGGLTKG